MAGDGVRAVASDGGFSGASDEHLGSVTKARIIPLRAEECARPGRGRDVQVSRDHAAIVAQSITKRYFTSLLTMRS